MVVSVRYRFGQNKEQNLTITLGQSEASTAATTKETTYTTVLYKYERHWPFQNSCCSERILSDLGRTATVLAILSRT